MMGPPFSTLGSGPRLLIWIGCTLVGVETGTGLGGWAGLVRRVGGAETGVVMTMPARGVVPVLLQGWPLTMRTWWMGAVEGSGEDSLVASITGLCSSCGAAIMGGGGAGAMGTLLDVAGLGLTCWQKSQSEECRRVYLRLLGNAGGLWLLC